MSTQTKLKLDIPIKGKATQAHTDRMVARITEAVNTYKQLNPVKFTLADLRKTLSGWKVPYATAIPTVLKRTNLVYETWAIGDKGVQKYAWTSPTKQISSKIFVEHIEEQRAVSEAANLKKIKEAKGPEPEQEKKEEAVTLESLNEKLNHIVRLINVTAAV
jgi:hypothetical protein